jgi:very-short-patch-repair endonuclease
MNAEYLRNHNLLTINGSVNSAVIRREKFKETSIYTEIINDTDWLSVDTSFGIRIKCIILGVEAYSYCNCGKKCQFTNKRNSVFAKTCGDSKCISKISNYIRDDTIKSKISKTKINNRKNIIDTFSDNYNKHIFNMVDISDFISDRVSRPKNRSLIDLSDYINHVDELSSILSNTDFISIENGDFKWSERMYCLSNMISSYPKCKCGEKLYYINRYDGYTNMCKSCMLIDTPKIRAANAIAKVKDAINSDYSIINDMSGINASKATLIHHKCGKTFQRWIKNGRWNNIKCPHCEYSISKIESDILQVVNSFTLAHKTQIDGVEFDIFAPSMNIAIEINGLYWHSESQGKNRQYHLNKYNIANENGIRLIHIFEDEITNQRDIVLSRLKNIFRKTKYKLYGRKCIIKELDTKTKDAFLNKYHIQGTDRSSIRLGAYYKNRLVAVMTFGKNRYGKDDDCIELIRYATIASFNCIGVAGKLLKHFERNYSPSKIKTYADLRWSNGNLYEKLGFEHTHNSPPNYFYIINGLRESRIKYQKHKLETKLDIFDPLLSEYENMKANGYDRIWDCGNMVFVKSYG